MKYSMQLQDFEKISSENISLQLLTQHHVDELIVQADPAIELVRRIGAGITLAEIEHFFSQQRRKVAPAKVFIAITTPGLKGVIEIGYSDMSEYNTKSNWWIHGIWVLDQHSRKGFGFSALQAVCKHLQRLSPDEIFANVHVTNAASIRTFEKAGFTKSFADERGSALFILK